MTGNKPIADLKYDSAVYPIRVDLYETFHPGSVVRVWGSLEGQNWVLLWAGEPQTGLKAVSRIFSPPIEQPHVLIKWVLMMCHILLSFR